MTADLDHSHVKHLSPTSQAWRDVAAKTFAHWQNLAMGLFACNPQSLSERTYNFRRRQSFQLAHLLSTTPIATMATELTVQSERAYQKQPHIFLNHKTVSKSRAVGKGGRRWYKDVGLGFRTPKTAIEGSYIGQ